MTRTDPSNGSKVWDRVERVALAPIDASWLAAYRILFGTALGISMLRYLIYGWVDRFFVEPTFHFKYWGFEWVEPLPAPGMHILFAVLAVLGFAIAAGAAFRWVTPVFAAGLTYVQLIDAATYLNHYYLAALLAWLLALSPANRVWSVDAWWRRRRGRDPGETIARAWQYLFRAQIGTVYFFAGMAKAQSDWLLHGQPLRIWLGANVDLPILGPLFTIEWVPLVMSWCGFLFDTTIVGWLLYRKTRPYAYCVVIVFHILTRLLFPIGMFPVIMVVNALVFFDVDWPRRLLGRVRRLFNRAAAATSAVALRQSAPPRGLLWRFRRWALAAGALYILVHWVMPFRYLVYGGNVLWHEQGMRFSWRVMVRAKGGSTTFIVRNKETGRVWHVNPRTYLTGMQEAEMSSQPDLILQLAHHIHDDFVRRGLGPVEVRAESRVAFNGRRGIPMIDPEVDLASIRDGLARADWVLPAPEQDPPHTRPVL